MFFFFREVRDANKQVEIRLSRGKWYKIVKICTVLIWQNLTTTKIMFLRILTLFSFIFVQQENE